MRKGHSWFYVRRDKASGLIQDVQHKTIFQVENQEWGITHSQPLYIHERSGSARLCHTKESLTSAKGSAPAVYRAVQGYATRDESKTKVKAMQRSDENET